MKFDRIKIDPSVCQGKATVRGMRITVEFVLRLLVCLIIGPLDAYQWIRMACEGLTLLGARHL